VRLFVLLLQLNQEIDWLICVYGQRFHAYQFRKKWGVLFSA